MTTFERIKKLAESRDKSLQDVAEELNFSRNLIYRWQSSSPKGSDLEKVADYFNVSVDYLLGRTDKMDWVQYDEENSEGIKKGVSGAKMFDTIAAHAKDRDADLTEEDLQQINDFVNFIIDKHKK
ncbi:helix-turn-helix transcriptional regulator [Listeria sp. FSL L7-1434]|uniref:helix-turn-helix domain-containing protein n=1 Tax=Listeria cossartiae TaxID=2838249 RepID=UPI0016283260|nr:helix-turn-helix transcriptional regulator [Listeria cossartiae]MBC1548833.1 helix-turn-helix transcriptional regulator [Listeria cossartiae subsp. cossartiae]